MLSSLTVRAFLVWISQMVSWIILIVKSETNFDELDSNTFDDEDGSFKDKQLPLEHYPKGGKNLDTSQL